MAVFGSLATKLQETFRKLRGKGKLSESDINEAMREIRLALLEADVNFKVVKGFISAVKERALGVEVLESLTPGQQVVKIVNDELVALLGSTESKIKIAPKPPTVIMLCGLQGAGKTTTVGKLGLYFKGQGRRPLLAACDLQRPAAIKQLQVVGDSIGLPVFAKSVDSTPLAVAKEGLAQAKQNGNDILIVDTAGRLHIDENLMDELRQMKAALNPDEILLVVDAMTGQDAVNVAQSFHESLDITGLIMTKLDGDARGGAALSVKSVTGCPIKFVGMGEKSDALEVFYPERMASRILGMGDMLTLIEKAQSAYDEKQTKAMEERLMKAEFTLEDFYEQMQGMKKMGSMQDLINMLPGVGVNKALKNATIDETLMKKTEAIIQSMTPQERRSNSILNGSRKKRIAAGSGTTVQDINKLLKQFEQTKKMMKQLGGMAKGKKGNLNLPGGFPGF
ncbi:MAG TPA: signal recognition particle protein [Clostridiales bacterium]|nr:signal recognition particle protein [Clostridiales bacterium]